MATLCISINIQTYANTPCRNPLGDSSILNHDLLTHVTDGSRRPWLLSEENDLRVQRSYYTLRETELLCWIFALVYL